MDNQQNISDSQRPGVVVVVPPVDIGITEEIEKLEARKEMAVFQRKITTELFTVMEYDMEIEKIDRRIELLRYKLKK